MRIKFSLKKCEWTAQTIGQDIIIHLGQCFSLADILECLKHEPVHALINQLSRKTTAQEDHFIMRRMDIDQF